MSELKLDLKDIHLPPDPSWWPPAPGWWMLALIVLIALAFGVPVLYRRVRATRRRAQLIKAFDQALTLPGATVADVSELLRRVVKRRDPAAAAVQGTAWLEHLDSSLRTREFLGEMGLELVQGAFQATPKAPSAGLLTLCCKWIREVTR